VYRDSEIIRPSSTVLHTAVVRRVNMYHLRFFAYTLRNPFFVHHEKISNGTCLPFELRLCGVIMFFHKVSMCGDTEVCVCKRKVKFPCVGEKKLHVNTPASARLRVCPSVIAYQQIPQIKNVTAEIPKKMSK